MAGPGPVRVGPRRPALRAGQSTAGYVDRRGVWNLAIQDPGGVVDPGLEDGTRTAASRSSGTAHPPHWERYTAVAVAHLRAQAGADTGDERLHALIGELSVKSDRFRYLWGRHDVRSAKGVPFRVRHPRVGPLELLVEKFQVVGATELETMLLHAEPGTSSADALALLASLDTTA
ncbi:hypothetical protein ACH4Y0_03205 [Streptomyces sp. NPDC020707]|uniref:MmyB family transcriptional regulator n=1 Tax=Streptomyces sp. NPDC020707 TaxID=3365084 RepID=UPI00379D47B2